MVGSAARRSLVGVAAVLAIGAGAYAVAQADSQVLPRANTPIEHVVVIFGENQSFDHYFGTYPYAANPAGQPPFTGVAPAQPVHGLTSELLTHNPNQANPRRLDRSEAVTCDHNHAYGAEQAAFNGGLMNKFVENTGGGSCADKGIVMAYYDGNTVGALWNYAQHYAMSDNHLGSTFGPSAVGAINFISGNTHGVSPAGAGESGSMIGNPQPQYDDCALSASASFTGKNIGDLLMAHGVTWGWFAGGFKPTSTSGGTAVCAGTNRNVAGGQSNDYIPHHNPFQYYITTANPHHLPPSAPDKIGQDDRANHQYDLTDFDRALADGNLPQVSFLKARAFEDGHPGYSGPIDEQRFIVRVVNAIMNSPQWPSTAIFLAYDDSDGWYDHVFAGIQNPSASPSDALNGPGVCGAGAPMGGYHGRCGPGPRLPLVVVSPYAKPNYVDNSQTEQASVIKFIEDNWNLGTIGDFSFDTRAASLNNMFDFVSPPRTEKLILDPVSGLRPGEWPPPAPTPTATATAPATPPPGPPPRPPVTTKPKPAVKLSCKVSGRGKRITISCKASGKDATKRTDVRFRIVRNNKVLATESGKLSKKKITVVIRPKKSLRKGKYTLRISVTQKTGVLALTRTIRLK
jgi:phospholipase C